MDRYTTALSRVEEILGSRARTAAVLEVPAEKIQAWLDGVEPTPLEVFLRSLDVIADGPYASGARCIRVAILDLR